MGVLVCGNFTDEQLIHFRSKFQAEKTSFTKKASRYGRKAYQQALATEFMFHLVPHHADAIDSQNYHRTLAFYDGKKVLAGLVFTSPEFGIQ
jgi:hypothetical protein